ncbi:MAG: polyphosphate kinase 1 [Acidimicrobiales bacterium]
MDDTGSDRFLNRELSWLDFDTRVLWMAEQAGIPLLERAKFLAIFAQNLDEFFQVRVAGLKDQVAGAVTKLTPDGRTAGQQLGEIRERVSKLLARQEQAFLDEIVPALADAGVRFSAWDELDDDDLDYLGAQFDERIFPVLTPLAVDPGHPFPYISDLSLNLAVVVHDPESDLRRFARVKVPPLLPRFVVMPDGERFVPLEQVIAAHLHHLFPGMEVVEHHPFRVTRNADLTLEDEDADDLLAAVEIELRRRRFGKAVRLELESTVTDEVRELLQRELDLDDDDVYVVTGPLDLSGLWSLMSLDRPDLKDGAWTGVIPPRLTSDDGRVKIFRAIRHGDLLLHHPYDSFAGTVEEFIDQAADDPKVRAIKLTLYRTDGDSPIVDALVRAAESGKQVAALVELKARFDEQANVGWARRLEKAGVHVAYGLLGLKVHTKTTLVVREEHGGMVRYCHIGTGNYNSRTARIYEDCGLLTADPEIGADLTHMFNYLTGYARDIDYRRLLVAPDSMRTAIRGLIRGEIEAGPGRGRILAKMNSLVDPTIIEDLYEASSAGVEIDLMIRGISCLRPGVPGLSDRIRVRSIVGRYLEHSRIFCFANGHGRGEAAWYIGSADWMPRNLDRRVEALTPVDTPSLQQRLMEVLQVNLADDTLAWTLGPEGDWSPPPGTGRVDTHLRLQELHRARS